MPDALNIAKTGLDISQQAIDIIAQNAANAKSLAYKQKMLVTTDNFYTTLKKAGLPDSGAGFSSPIPVQRGSGAKVAGVMKIMTQGPRKDTKNPLDMYIQGGGYFAVNLPNNQIGYTRMGAFRINQNRDVITMDEGYTLVDAINIPQGVAMANVNISNLGLITDGATGNVIGQIHITTFPNELGLEDIGSGIALETTASGAPTASTPGANETVGSIIQAAVELSNVSQIEALTGLIEAQRAYELNLKIVAAQSEIMKNTNDTYTK
jgi:flagellar basal-body rod protein FlgG